MPVYLFRETMSVDAIEYRQSCVSEKESMPSRHPVALRLNHAEAPVVVD